MAGFIEGVSRDQTTLFTDRMDDWVAEDNLARIVDIFVDELDLAELGFATPGVLDSSGNRVRDEAIVATLRTMQLAVAPANPGAPFVMLILPRTGATNDCEAAP